MSRGVGVRAGWDFFIAGSGLGLSLENEGKGRGKYLIQKYPSRKRTGFRDVRVPGVGSCLVWSCRPFTVQLRKSRGGMVKKIHPRERGQESFFFF